MSDEAHERYATRLGSALGPPQSLRTWGRVALRHAALSVLARVPRPRGERFLRPLYCHYVFDDQRERFERAVRALRNVGEFIDTNACLDVLEGQRVLDGRYFHLSFDDGYRNVFTNALPILVRHRVPAIVFACTALMDADWSAARAARVRIWESRTPQPLTGVVEMLRWSDLREMAAAGFEVGSHTRTHACLAEVSGDPRALREELAGSRGEIESRLGRACRYLSWPYGTLRDVDARVLEAIRAAGYRAAFGAFRGSVVPGVTDRSRIPRHHFEAQFPVSHLLYFAHGGWEGSR